MQVRKSFDKLDSLNIFLFILNLILAENPLIPICSLRSRETFVRIEKTGRKSGQIGCNFGPGDSHEYPWSVRRTRRCRLLPEWRQKSTGMRNDRDR